MTIKEIFLSTPSARRATSAARRRVRPKAISIHALREEGDYIPENIFYRLAIFLSTPSARRATSSGRPARFPVNISIHALREEGDFGFSTISTMSSYFYPRPPRGGRQAVAWRHPTVKEFLSTPSARRATSSSVFRCCTFSISIHALREEGDERALKLVKESITFLSTPSARRATQSFRARL